MVQAKSSDDIRPALLAGWAAAKGGVEGWRRAGLKPAREKIQRVPESRRKLDIDGLEVSYSAEGHTGLDFADLSIIGTDDKFRDAPSIKRWLWPKREARNQS